MGVPKRRKSSSRVRSRRAHEAIVAANVIKCPSCGEAVISHRMCPKCGKYRDRVVKEISEE